VSAAKEQAAADKFIARTQANAAIKQTQIQSSTTLTLAANQKAVTEEQTRATERIATLQQDSSTDRLELQLASLGEEREAQQDERQVIRAEEQRRAQEQIAFPREQAQRQIDLAQQTFNLQLVQAGLSTGLSSTSAGSGLTTTAIGGGVTARPQTLGTGTSTTNTLGNALGGTGSTGQIAQVSGGNILGNSLGSAGSATSTGQAVTARAVTAQPSTTPKLSPLNKRRGISSKPSMRLLSSVRGAVNSPGTSNSLVYRGSSRGLIQPRFNLAGSGSINLRGIGRGIRRSRGFLMRTPRSRGLRITMDRNLPNILGSTRAIRNRIVTTTEMANSDLTQFTRAVSRSRSRGLAGSHSRRTR